MTGYARPLTMKMLRDWADWEDIYNDLADLLRYWESQPSTTEQKQNVCSIKEVRRMIEDIIKEGESEK